MSANYFWKKPIFFWVAFFVLITAAVVLIEINEEPEEVLSFPLASGKRTYEIITGSPRNFQIIEVSVDPLDVKRGEIQKVEVLVKDVLDSPITYENKVEGTVYTDNSVTPFPLFLKRVDDADGGTLTAWEGFWTLEDTYNSTYMITITAKSAAEEHSIDLTFR